VPEVQQDNPCCTWSARLLTAACEIPDSEGISPAVS